MNQDQMDATAEPDEDDPAANFNLLCATCHGADLRGAAGGIDLVERLPQLTDDEALDSIKTGVPPRMPAWGDSLSDEEILALIDYLRSRIE